MDTKENFMKAAESGLVVGAAAALLFPLAAIWQHKAIIAVVAYGVTMFMICGMSLHIADVFYPVMLYLPRKAMYILEDVADNSLTAGFIGTAAFLASVITHIFVRCFCGSSFMVTVIFVTAIVAITGYLYFFVSRGLLLFSHVREVKKTEKDEIINKNETAATPAVEDEYF